MCLAKVFINNSSEQPILKDIARMCIHKDRVELVTLFDGEKVINGKVVEIDFLASRILLNEQHDGNNT